MQIAQKLAGFSLAKADLLRRAMGKKIKSEMKAQRNNFINGCKNNGIRSDIAEKLFFEIEKFAGYGFNKSHAAAYALIAFQTAYLKTHFPLEFFCASMQCENGNIEKISLFCKEVKNLGFKIFNPDINYSEECFQVCYDIHNNAIGINYALSAIKNIGESSIKKLVYERRKNGKYRSLEDLLKRLDNTILNKRQLESLTFSGSMNSVEKNGFFIEKNLLKILKFNTSYHENKNFFQENLFSNEKIDFLIPSDSNEWDIFTKLKKEYDSIGFYLSSHPLEFCKEIVDQNNFDKLEHLLEIINNIRNDKQIFNCLVIINEFTQKVSRSGSQYAFVSLSDETEEIEAICFSDTLLNIDKFPNPGDICKVKLDIISKNNQRRLVLIDLETVDVQKNFKNQNLSINIDPLILDSNSFEKFLKKNVGGENNIIFHLKNDNYKIKIESKDRFKLNLNILNSLKKISGIKLNKKN